MKLKITPDTPEKDLYDKLKSLNITQEQFVARYMELNRELAKPRKDRDLEIIKKVLK